MKKILIFFCFLLLVMLSLSMLRKPVRETGSLSEKYPGDKGIENDKDVLFAEMFEEELPEVFSRYTDIKNGKGMQLADDIPKGSKGQRALMITNTGGENTGGHLFRKISPGWDSTVFIRYYVKYPSISKGFIHHQGVKLGGNNPALDYHQGRAGLCGLGDVRFSIAYEPNNEPEMDTYLYWGDMKSWNGGTSCYGNTLINGTPARHDLSWDKWMCIEMMIKLNNPVSANNGELRIWQDGKEVGYWGENFPKGFWKGAGWINDPSGNAFEGFRWRTDPLLDINFIRIEHYDSKSKDGDERYILYDHIVVAKKYIGPLK